MTGIPRTVGDILRSGTRRALPRQVDFPDVDIASYVQGVDNFHKVFAIRPDDHVVYLCDPLIDPRVGQAIYGLAKARGATFASYMGASTQLTRAPDEARALIERADFVVSTWFASVVDPFFIGLRRDNGQRWIKITFFRNLDLLKTPHARFPVDLLGRNYPRDLAPLSRIRGIRSPIFRSQGDGLHCPFRPGDEAQDALRESLARPQHC